MQAQTTPPDRARFVLRVEVTGEHADRYERALLRLAESLPGAQLSRSDYETTDANRLRLLRRRKLA